MSIKSKVRTYDLVKQTMRIYPDTQSDDLLLYRRIMNMCGVSQNIPFKYLFTTNFYKYNKLPSLRTVVRMRAKVQEDNPEEYPRKKQPKANLNTLKVLDESGTISTISIDKCVETILRTKPQSRNNDLLLYAYVLNYCSIPCADIPFVTICEKIRQGEYPMFTSIDVARRRVQSKFPGELDSLDNIKTIRKEEINSFRQFNKLDNNFLIQE